MTSAERRENRLRTFRESQKAYTERLRKEGKKTVNVLIDGDSRETLRQIKEAQGHRALGETIEWLVDLAKTHNYHKESAETHNDPE